MESVAFTYDGADSATATITNAQIGHEYFFVAANGSVSDTAVSSTLILNCTNIDSSLFGDIPIPFSVGDNTSPDNMIAADVFHKGSTSEYEFEQTWTYDSVTGDVTLTFPSDLGVDYILWISAWGTGYDDTTFTGDGTVMTKTVNAIAGGMAGDFIGNLAEAVFGVDPTYASRFFVLGESGAGYPGNPSPAVPTGPVFVTLDGVDVTNCCVAGNWTRRLNRPSTAQIRTPMDCTNAGVGSILKIEALVGTTYEIVHHGRVLLVETDTGEDFGYTTYNSTDPMEMWQWRPVRDNDCDFSDPQIISEYLTGPAIIEAALNNSIDCGDGSQADCEGNLFLTVNAAASGGVDLTGAPTDWPMTIAELTSLLVSTGEVDVVITPTDPGGGIMGEVDFYNGDYGTDLSATVVFSYGMGDYNVRRVRWNQDMTTMVNKLWYYGGPKIATAADPAAVQHWCWNITGDDPAFNPGGNPTGAWGIGGGYFVDDTVTNGGRTYICKADNVATAADEPGVGVNWPLYWVVLSTPPGGRNSPPASSTDNPLGVLRVASEGAYGVRMDIQIFDAYDDCAGVGTVGRDLYRYRWQTESWLRAQPREIIHVTPIRGTEIGTFDIGDLVTVEATAAVRGGFSGVQRVYEYTVSWDQDGVLELSELQTSADNEGL